MHIRNKNSNTITRLSFAADSGWRIEVNNRQYQAELVGECIVTLFLIWLNFSTTLNNGRKKTYRVLIFPDSADKDLLRQLRVQLRFENTINTGDKVEPVLSAGESTKTIK